MSNGMTRASMQARNEITSIERRIVGTECWALIKDGTGMYGCCFVQPGEDGEFLPDSELGEDDIGERDPGSGFWFKTERLARKEFDRICEDVARG